MACYLTKYVGTYRVKACYDLDTNDFPRDCEGRIDPSFEDLYIDCAHGWRIYHYSSKGSRVILEGYCPSKIRGNNIVKELGDIVLDTHSNDSELWFYFNANNIATVAEAMKAKTSGKSISPFSVKNLPKNHYEINTEDMSVYRSIISALQKNELIYLSIWTTAFMNDYLQKTHHIRGASSKAKSECLTARNYIHKHGYWNEYCEYLKTMIQERHSNSGN